MSPIPTRVRTPVSPRTIAPPNFGRPLARTPLVASGGSEPLLEIVGQTAGYNGGQFGWGDQLQANRWEVTSRMGTLDLEAICFYAHDAVGQARFAVWTDNGLTADSAAPDDLIAATGAVTLVDGWNEAPLVAELPPGKYWWSVNLSSNSCLFFARLGSERGSGLRTAAHTFGAMPSVYPTSTYQSDVNIGLYAKLRSRTKTQPPPDSNPGTPSPIAGLGYSLVFQDEFQWFNREQWTNQVWWDGTAQPDSQFVENGVLKLVSRETDGYDFGSGNPQFYIDGWPHVLVDTLGFPGLDTFRYGYYETRMRSTDCAASYPAFWLFSSDWAKADGDTSGCPGQELDVVELWGDDWPQAYSGTCHSNTPGGDAQNPGPCANFPDFNNQSDPAFNGDVGFATIGQWHKYSALWEPDLVTFYLDDVEMHTSPAGVGTDWATFDTANMHLICYLWPWQGGQLSGPPTQVGEPSEIVAEFDYVRVWQA